MSEKIKCEACGGEGTTYTMGLADNMDMDLEICETCNGTGLKEE